MAEDAFARWSSRHDGLDPHGSAWVTGWVRLTDGCARPLAARGVSPDAVTVVGVLLAALVPVLAALGSAWPLVAVLPAVVAAVLDGVDGALASLTDRAGAWGRVVDGLADRLSDVALLLVLVVLGAAWWLVGAVVVLTLLLESARAVAQAAGLAGPGVVTFWERPSRVIVACFGSGLVGIAWLVGVDVPWLPWAATAAGLLLAVAALAQLLPALRRALP